MKIQLKPECTYPLYLLIITPFPNLWKGALFLTANESQAFYL